MGKRFTFNSLLQIKFVRNTFGSKQHAFKIKVHVPMSHLIRTLCHNVFNIRFLKTIHLVICSHKYKVRDHHKIQTQTTHGEWVITFLNKIRINKDISKIQYGNIYYIVQLNTIHVISQLYHLKFIFQSLIILHMNHTLESRLTTLTNFIIYNSLTLWNNYTKTQTYMQCDIMPLKNNTRAPRSTWQDTSHNGYVRSLLLSEIIRWPIKVTLFCENALIMWNQHRLKWALKSSVFTTRARLQRIH